MRARSRAESEQSCGSYRAILITKFSRLSFALTDDIPANEVAEQLNRFRTEGAHSDMNSITPMRRMQRIVLHRTVDVLWRQSIVGGTQKLLFI
jgi:hypothetical protein